MPPTALYLVRHGETDANLANPPRLLGRRLDPPLAPLGVRQAEAARDALAGIRLAHCYASPLRRARQTAAILCQPHGLTPQPLEALAECDLGRWEGLDWQTIAAREPEAYERFLADPARHGHPGGQSYQDVVDRSWPVLEHLLARCTEQDLLVVTHQVVLRTWRARLLGLPLRQARQFTLANGAVLVVEGQGHTPTIRTLEGTPAKDVAPLPGAS